MADRIATGTIVGPDNTPWAKTIYGLGSLFDPKSQLEGETLRAHAGYYDASARKTGIEADMLGDRRKALGTESLVAAGLSPLQIAILQSTGDTNSQSAAHSVGYLKGYEGLTGGTGDVRTNLALTGNANVAYGDPNFAPNDERQDQLLRNSAEAANARATKVAQINADARTDAAKIQAAAAVLRGSGKTDANTQPFNVKDPAGDLVRLFGYTDEAGVFHPPSEEDVVQPILGTMNDMISSGLSTRQSAQGDALNVLGYQPKKDVKKESNWGREKEVTYARPAKAPAIDASTIPTQGDVGEVIEVPANNLGLIRDPNGPVMNAPIGAVVKIGNAAYMKVQGPDGKAHLQRVRPGSGQ